MNIGKYSQNVQEITKAIGGLLDMRNQHTKEADIPEEVIAQYVVLHAFAKTFPLGEDVDAKWLNAEVNRLAKFFEE